VEAMHPISGLKTLKRPLMKCGGISIAIRLFMSALLGGRWSSQGQDPICPVL
jgi:hypothetical protein